MSDSTELYYAEMEAAGNKAEDAYFAARLDSISDTSYERKFFTAGFERAFQLLWDRLPSGISQYTCTRHVDEVKNGGKCCWCQLEDARRAVNGNGE